tara:strand:+ start:2791 stop:4386 length:1596 start_codon:yes stop_codon:yes gene_type:complete
MIERSLAIISNKTRRGSLALRNDLRNSFRVERALERNSLALKRKLVEDRDRTLKALALRSTQKERDRKGGVGGALSLLGGGALGRRFFGRPPRGGLKIPRVPKVPTRGGAFLSRVGKVGKLGKIGPLAVIGTGIDFVGRKAEGQTNLQAGLGAGGGLAGALAGAKYGAILGTAIGGPIGTVVGGIGGSIIGGLAGGKLADFFSGADRRRKFEEQRVEISTQKTLFSSALDDLDRVLDKLESTPLFMAKKEDDDGLPEKRFPFGRFFPKPKPDTPFYKQPAVEIIAYGLLLAGAVVAGGITGEEYLPLAGLINAMGKTKIGAFILKKSPFLLRYAKKAAPFADDVLVPGKQIPKISPKGIELRANKILRDLGTFVKKQVKVTKGRKNIKGKKTLKNQDKVTFSDTPDGSNTVIRPKPGELEKSLRLIERINKKMNKNINSRKKRIFIQKNLFKNLKSDVSGGGTPTASLENEENNNIALAPTNNIFIIQQGDNTSQSTPQTQGGNTILIGGGTSDPFTATLNMAQMEVLQTV